MSVRYNVIMRHRRSISYSGLKATLDASLFPTSPIDCPPVPTLAPEPRLLGNMYLSSCPGKKGTPGHVCKTSCLTACGSEIEWSCQGQVWRPQGPTNRPSARQRLWGCLYCLVRRLNVIDITHLLMRP